MRFLLVACGLLFAPLIGCGSGAAKNELSGTVKFQGKPLPEGTIRFIPERGTASPLLFGPISGGTFTIPEDKGAAPGTYRVEITAVRKTGKKAPVPDSPPGTMQEVEEQYIPREYNVDSKLTVEVGQGKVAKDFDIGSAKGPKK